MIKIENKFNSFLKSLMDKSDIKIKVKIEINKQRICFTRRVEEYSVPISEQIAIKPTKIRMKGITKSFFDNLYQLPPSKLLSSLKRIFFKI